MNEVELDKITVDEMIDMEEEGLLEQIIKAGGATLKALEIVNVIPITLEDLVKLEKLIQEADARLSIMESMILGKYELKGTSSGSEG